MSRQRVIAIQDHDKDYMVANKDIQPIAGLFYILNSFNLMGDYYFWYSI